MDEGNNKQETKTRPKLKVGKPFQMGSPAAPEEKKDLQHPPPVQDPEQPPAPSPAPVKPKPSKLKSGSTPFASKGETASVQPQQQYEYAPMPVMTTFYMNPMMGGPMPVYQLPQALAPEIHQQPTHVETNMKLKPRGKVLNQGADKEETSKEGLYKEVIVNFDEFEQDPEQYGIEDFPKEYFEMYEEELHDQIAREFDEDWEDYYEVKSANCDCCKGHINKCNGSICRSLGKCQCVMRLEMEEDAVEHFIDECRNCPCCKGFVYTCLGAECRQLGVCFCFSP